MGDMLEGKEVKVALHLGQAQDTGPCGGRSGAGSFPLAREGEGHRCRKKDMHCGYSRVRCWTYFNRHEHEHPGLESSEDHLGRSVPGRLEVGSPVCNDQAAP